MLKSQKRSMLDWLLDILASPIAMILVVSCVSAVSYFSIEYVRVGDASAQQAKQLFDGPTVRENAHAVSDIYRLQFSVKTVVSDGGFTPESRAEFLSALDMLYMRADSFARGLASVPYREDSARALSAMNEIITISDQERAAGFPDIASFSVSLNDAARRAHTSLVQYMNALHVDQQVALSGTSASLGNLTRWHSLFLAFIVAFTIGNLLLLRREVVNRKRRAEAEERVSYLAYHDSLTGLGNRTRFTEAGESFFAIGPDGHFEDHALAFIDLDEFKEINDVYGHPIGDEVLRHAAQMIVNVSNTYNGLPIRVAGDEFAVLLPTGDPEAIRKFADELLAFMSVPMQIHDNTIIPKFSIGAATAKSVEKTAPVSLETMSKAADYALYAAKRMAGHGNLQLFDDELSQQLALRRSRLEALDRALRNDGLDIWLQPQIDLQNWTLSGFEALARWMHEGEMIPPGEFIILAEESGLIVELDDYILDGATRAMARWNAEHQAQVPISVNISAAHIGSPKLISAIERALENSGLPPELLTLELTETVEVRDWNIVVERLNAIRALGCRLSIDDFGSGYSSLGYLRNMPAHELKIDRSLVIDIESSQEGQAIVSSVVDIAHTLSFSTVIEGIETPEQAAVARRLGCTHAQGYLFCKPMPAEDVGSPDGIFPETVLTALKDSVEEPMSLLRDTDEEDGVVTFQRHAMAS